MQCSSPNTISVSLPFVRPSVCPTPRCVRVRVQVGHRAANYADRYACSVARPADSLVLGECRQRPGRPNRSRRSYLRLINYSLCSEAKGRPAAVQSGRAGRAVNSNGRLIILRHQRHVPADTTAYTVDAGRTGWASCLRRSVRAK